MKRYLNIGKFKYPVIFLLAVLVFWEWAVGFFHFPAYILPSPSGIFTALKDFLPVLLPGIKVTLMESLVGLMVAVITAIILALIMDSSETVKNTVYPVLIVSQTVPLISIAPLFIIWLGYGILPKVVVVILVCFFPMVISLMDGLVSVDEDLINLLKTMGASPGQVFKMVKLPGAMPAFFSGLKISATYSVMGAVIGEWLGASKGIGVFMVRAQKSFSLDKVFAAVLAITLLSMGIFAVVKVLERLSLPWLFINQEKTNKKKGFDLN